MPGSTRYNNRRAWLVLGWVTDHGQSFFCLKVPMNVWEIRHTDPHITCIKYIWNDVPLSCLGTPFMFTVVCFGDNCVRYMDLFPSCAAAMTLGCA